MSNRIIKTSLIKRLLVFMVFISLGAIVLEACHSDSRTSEESRALNLMETNCYSCHHPTSPEDSRLAPPMYAVKKHYLDAYKDQESFIEAFTAFVNSPSKENALMKGAVNKFGLMAEMQFSIEDVKAIAEYVYHQDLPKPDWFDDHHQKKKKKQHSADHTSSATEAALAKGKSIALSTKAALGKNLMKAINERGTEGAVTFCNIKALPITDSLAQFHNAKVKRVSDKNRNPLNAANEKEMDYILTAKKEISNGQMAKPMVKKVNGNWVGYYPITTNAMCLQCHGKAKDIQSSTLATIEAKYPNDKAQGYGENELRGIWVVEF